MSSTASAQIILIDDRLGSDNATGLTLNASSNHEIASGLNGQIAAFSAISGTGSNILITNDGSTLAVGSAVILSGGSLAIQSSVVNNGWKTATQNGIGRASGGRVTISGSIIGQIRGLEFNSVAELSTFANTGGAAGEIAAAGGHVGNEAIITGEAGAGVKTENAVPVANAGTILGEAYGVYADSDTGANVGLGQKPIVNSGIVSGREYKGATWGTDAGVENSGDISGGTNGVHIEGADGLAAHSGDITARGTGVYWRGMGAAS